MVSKSRKQAMKKKAKEGAAPEPISERKSVHLKKTRPHMRHKHKIRLGMTSADIYEGFEDKSGVKWVCQTCGKVGHVIGYCAACAASQTESTGEEAALPPALGKMTKKKTVGAKKSFATNKSGKKQLKIKGAK
jgi:hypothetical protein